jgi:hypothetical protein
MYNQKTILPAIKLFFKFLDLVGSAFFAGRYLSDLFPRCSLSPIYRAFLTWLLSLHRQLPEHFNLEELKKIIYVADSALVTLIVFRTSSCLHIWLIIGPGPNAVFLNVREAKLSIFDFKGAKDRMKDKYISFSSLNLTVFRKRKWRTGQK